MGKPSGAAGATAAAVAAAVAVAEVTKRPRPLEEVICGTKSEATATREMIGTAVCSMARTESAMTQS